MQNKFHMIHQDAFSSGQISSKLWLCEQLEQTGWTSNLTYIYGGWYGITAFLLLSRNNFKVDQIQSFDIDPSCEPIADMINENWVWQDWKFKAYTLDCNGYVRGNPDLIINTSTEHFDSFLWWDNIKPGTAVALQGNNMQHDDHVNNTNSLDEFCEQFPLAQEIYRGSMDFNYPNWSFSRYMVIGIK